MSVIISSTLFFIKSHVRPATNNVMNTQFKHAVFHFLEGRLFHFLFLKRMVHNAELNSATECTYVYIYRDRAMELIAKLSYIIYTFHI